jgi:hypothetical protein
MGLVDMLRSLGSRAASGLDDIGISFARRGMDLEPALAREILARDAHVKARALEEAAKHLTPGTVQALEAAGKPATAESLMEIPELAEKITAKARQAFKTNDELAEMIAPDIAANELLGGVGALGAMGGALYGGKKLVDWGEPKRAAAVGTPFTDGFFKFCIDQDLDGEQVAEMLEKGAQASGRTGKECRGLLDRI